MPDLLLPVLHFRALVGLAVRAVKNRSAFALKFDELTENPDVHR